LVDEAAFKNAMSSFPSGVVIATTVDAAGRRWGFTASAFSSVSLAPPLVLVCLAKSAESQATFRAAQRLAISVLASGDEALAKRFATRGADKFSGNELQVDAWGMPVVSSSVAALSCHTHSVVEGGDHLIIIAGVDQVRFDGRQHAMVHYQRDFWRFGPSGELRPAGAA
jgi:flavin reductase ActVB